jgi:hypothetical protein
LTSGNTELIDIPRAEVRPAPSKIEVQMHARAARMAREVLEKELSNAKAQTDHDLTGQLELQLRRAGAEDVVVLVSDGTGTPVPPCGSAVRPHTSVVVAIEHNGHWAKVTRNVAGVTSSLSARDGVTELRELLSGPYSWETIGDAATPAVISLQLQIQASDRTLYYGDTYLQGEEGLRIL